MQLNVLNAWSELPDFALDLLTKAQDTNLYNGISWYSIFAASVVGSRDKTRWLLLSSDDRALLLLPLLEHSENGLTGLKSLSNYYTPYFSHVCAHTESRQLLTETFKRARDFLSGYDLIEFHPLTQEVHDEFHRASGGLGFRRLTTHQTYNWRQLGIEDFDSYWSSRDSRLRNTVRRKLRKIGKEGEYRFQIVANEDIDQGLLDYKVVYAKSWKPEEDHPAFIEAIMREFAQTGALRLGILYDGRNPVAAQLWLVLGDVAHIYKLAYDPAYASLSVGTLLSHFLFQWVVEEDGVHHVDFLTGDDEYKSQWMDHRRPLFKLTLANTRRPRGAVYTLKQSLKHALRMS